MKLQNLLIIFLFLSIGPLGASIQKAESNALSMVPKGRIVHKNLRELTLKTTAGTKVKLEFERKGEFQEASGLNLNRGDEFEPGNGLVSLSTAARSVARAGHEISGEWNLEKDPEMGWVYEIVEEADDKKIFHLVQAKTGRLMSSVDVPAAREAQNARFPSPSATTQ